MEWGVIVAQPQRHRVVAENLTSLGNDHFIPMVETLSVVRGRHHRRKFPLFGRYVLVEITAHWRKLRRLQGVSGMLLDPCGQPSLIEPERLDYLRTFCDGNLFKPPGAEVVKPAALVYGQHVSPKTGPFQDFIGTYDGLAPRKMEAAIFFMFGREQRVEFKRGDLIAA
jgi:transcription antitermination factor NusG